MKKNKEKFKELLEFLKVGQEYSMYLGKTSSGWVKIEVRDIIDNEVLIYKIKSPRDYMFEYLDFIEKLFNIGWLVLNNNEDNKNG